MGDNDAQRSIVGGAWVETVLILRNFAVSHASSRRGNRCGGMFKVIAHPADAEEISFRVNPQVVVAVARRPPSSPPMRVVSATRGSVW